MEALRESDPDVDALITDLKRQLSDAENSPSTAFNQKSFDSCVSLSRKDIEELADLIAAADVRSYSGKIISCESGRF
jgi:hypothetical protein